MAKRSGIIGTQCMKGVPRYHQLILRRANAWAPNTKLALFDGAVLRSSQTPATSHIRLADDETYTIDIGYMSADKGM